MAKKDLATWDHTRIFLRPIASGVPLGFFSFSIGMLMLGCAALDVIPITEMKQVGLVLVLFAFPLELIATIFAFLARDSMSVATLGLFAASWLTLGVFDIASAPGQTSVSLGIYLFGFAGALLLIAAMAVKTKPFFTVLLIVAAIREILSGIYEVGGSHSFYITAGYFTLVLCAFGLYGGVAFTLEDMHQKAILPLFRRGSAEAAFSGYERQLEKLEAEPGVRQSL
jgi:succinate-acetate transporter protein